MNINEQLQAFRTNQPLDVWRRVELGADQAQHHLDRITDLYDKLEGHDEVDGQDQWVGKGFVKHTEGGQISTLIYEGDTTSGQGKLFHETPVEKVTQETVFEPGVVRQFQVHEHWRGTMVSVWHLDRNDPSQSYKLYL